MMDVNVRGVDPELWQKRLPDISAVMTDKSPLDMERERLLVPDWHERAMLLEAEVERLRAESHNRWAVMDREVEQLRAALEQYADRRNWFQTEHQTSIGIPTKVWAWEDSREPWTMAQKALDRDKEC